MWADKALRTPASAAVHGQPLARLAQIDKDPTKSTKAETLYACAAIASNWGASPFRL